MKISREWLQTYFADPLPSAEELARALTFHAFEIDGIEEVEGDSILDVKVTPNRGHDCLSHQGIARELSAILRRPLTRDPLRDGKLLATKGATVRVSIAESSLCYRFTAAHIQNVKVGPTPAWLKQRIEAIGQRSINNIVDATNYVMFDTGQPLHAFDAGQLTTQNDTYAIKVRRATKGETMLALDDKEYTFTEDNLLVVDANRDVPVGIAGVKGGKPAGVGEATRDIVLESANFNGVSVRKTAQALKLRTDASSRFEQVLSPDMALVGLSRVIELILEIAGGTLVSVVDEYPEPRGVRTVSVTTSTINRYLGTDLTDEVVAETLIRLGLPFVRAESKHVLAPPYESTPVSSPAGELFIVTPPYERLDLWITQDLIEEVGRIVGYESVKAVELLPLPKTPEINTRFVTTEKIRTFLVEKGFSEVFTSVFRDHGVRAVMNKVGGERPFLRESLAPGLEEALEKNYTVKEAVGLSDVRLFEIGTVWGSDKEEVHLALGVKGGKKSPKADVVVSELCEVLGVTKPVLKEAHGVIEIPLESLLGFKTTSVYDSSSESPNIRYRAFSRYPFIVRDVALWVPNTTEASEIEGVIRTEAGELLQRLDQFDRFERDGRTSYAFRLVFQSFERTLTDTEVEARMEAISAALVMRGFEIR